MIAASLFISVGRYLHTLLLACEISYLITYLNILRFEHAIGIWVERNHRSLFFFISILVFLLQTHNAVYVDLSYSGMSALFQVNVCSVEWKCGLSFLCLL